ncbi:hypothetical protein [Candidatus Viridilinea mediisalina]|uniref:Uncharacterized protein n=1 Tax=Candidatus Viridilinea mediisalina TaxID=2024553 RepID=A0A2A6RD85_9CHLR|nr:hypothetical protein [Candidatus Viridilinea mediisalina]PDV98020.1 hypothetical protein CJ255_22110 [Candidatus Viridilinea mediisalina]
MTSLINPTLDQVLTLAQSLSTADQLRLIARLADGAVNSNKAANNLSTNDAWVRWTKLREELSAQMPGKTTMAEQLEKDRQDRQLIMEGDSVHN